MIPILMLSLSSCTLLYYMGQFADFSGNDMNENQKYSPFAEDFKDTDHSFHYYDCFYPTKDALYYFGCDDAYNGALYKADSEGTVCIAKDSTGALQDAYLDMTLNIDSGRICFSAIETEINLNPFSSDEYDVVTTRFLCVEEGSNEIKTLYRANETVEYWNISGDRLVYFAPQEEPISEHFPYSRAAVKTVDMKSGSETVITENNAVYMDLAGSKIIFITFTEEDGFTVSSCDVDGKNMTIHKKIDIEFNSRYGYIDRYDVNENYVVMWGDTGVGDSETDVIVFSLADQKTYHHTYPLYSNAFALADNYAYITFIREDESPLDDPEPMENEGIFRLDLVSGETELISKEMAFCVDLLALDDDCVYGLKYYYANESLAEFNNEIFRIKKGSLPSLVYSYKEN